MRANYPSTTTRRKPRKGYPLYIGSGFGATSIAKLSRHRVGRPRATDSGLQRHGRATLVRSKCQQSAFFVLNDADISSVRDQAGAIRAERVTRLPAGAQLFPTTV